MFLGQCEVLTKDSSILRIVFDEQERTDFSFHFSLQGKKMGKCLGIKKGTVSVCWFSESAFEKFL